MTEIFVDTGNTSKSFNHIIAISNFGRIKRKNGIIDDSHYRQKVKINGKLIFIHRFIAEHFIPKTEEDIILERNQIDHITHNPTLYNINDVRNLRWCTNKENHNFPEVKENLRKANLGKKLSSETKQKMSNSRKNNKNKLNKPTSTFGKIYFEYYGYSKKENRNQYNNELQYYKKYGKLKGK